MLDAVDIELYSWLIIGDVKCHRRGESLDPVANTVGEGIYTYKARVRSVSEIAIGGLKECTFSRACDYSDTQDVVVAVAVVA